MNSDLKIILSGIALIRLTAYCFQVDHFLRTHAAGRLWEANPRIAHAPFAYATHTPQADHFDSDVARHKKGQ